MSQLKAIVTLDTGEKSEYIHIYEGDDVELLAEFFCERHQILNEGKQYIIQEIMRQLSISDQTKKKVSTQVSTKQIISHSQSQAIIPIMNQVKKSDYEHAHKGVWNKIDKPQCKGSLHSRGHSNYQYVQQKSQTQTTFKKNTGISAKCHTNIELKPEPPRTSRQEQISLANRLISQKSISEKRLQQMRFESKSPIGMNFKPTITKDRIFNKVSQKVDQEDYDLALKIGDSKKAPGKRKIFEENQPKIACTQNLAILRKIFSQLDGDNDGQISRQFINLNINHQILEKISPVLLHMEEQHLILDLDSFSQLIRSFNILIY